MHCFPLVNPLKKVKDCGFKVTNFGKGKEVIIIHTRRCTYCDTDYVLFKMVENEAFILYSNVLIRV